MADSLAVRGKEDSRVLGPNHWANGGTIFREEKVKNKKSRIQAVAWSSRWLFEVGGKLSVYLIMLCLCGLSM